MSAAQDTIDHFIELLEEKSFKKTLIKEINDDVDIPMIGERTEKKVFDAVYKALLRALKKVEV
jgi:hypothetical protein